MKYHFTVLWARFLTALGIALVGAGFVFAGVALAIETPWGSVTGQVVLERTLAAVFLIVSGILAGGPLIVFGQLLQIFVDQRRLLARIGRRLRRWESRLPPEPEPPPGDRHRFRPR